MDEELAKFKEKYKRKLKERLEGIPKNWKPKTKNYLDFKKENYPDGLSRFEKACNFAYKALKMSPPDESAKEIQKNIDIVHLNTTPAGVFSLAILSSLGFVILGFLSYMILPILFGTSPGSFGIILTMILAGGAYFVVMKVPYYAMIDWRMRAASEMVLAVFYIVTYMRHTSNLENAIAFAAEHLSGPLAMDLRKVIWDIETEKFQSIKESLDDYLLFWKDTNMEFVEAMHLIESSLYESSESRRIDTLEKALDVILEETYEKMLHYAQGLKSPMTTLHMLGIILPILGLVMLPLIGGFMTNTTHPLRIVMTVAGIYNILIPLSVYYFGKTILADRPGGYGNVDLSKLKKFKKYQGVIVNIFGKDITISPIFLALGVGIVLILISLTPVLMHAVMDTDYVYGPLTKCGKSRNDGFHIVKLSSDLYKCSVHQFLGYKKAQLEEIKGEYIGPYGLGAAILSLFFPLGVALGIGLYYKYKTKNLMMIRENSKKLEDEFASSLFQLGNRLGDGLPAEIAFQKVSSASEGTLTGEFFKTVANNISRLGMSVKDALFDPIVGAVRQYPSSLIESSMKVLTQASRKGPLIAAQALVNISKYVKEIHRVEERLKDLLADIIGSMKSQINFLTPVIAGVVVGITSMVTYILSRLKTQIENVAQGKGASMGQYGGMLKMFGDGVPTYYVQIVVGLYVMEMVFLLSSISNKIENGPDTLSEKWTIGKNLVKSGILYTVLAFIIMIMFNLMAAKFLPNG